MSNRSPLSFHIIVLAATALSSGCAKNDAVAIVEKTAAPSTSPSSPSVQTSAAAPDGRCGGSTRLACPPGQACKVDPKDKDGLGSCGPAGAPPKF